MPCDRPPAHSCLFRNDAESTVSFQWQPHPPSTKTTNYSPTDRSSNASQLTDLRSHHRHRLTPSRWYNRPACRFHGTQSCSGMIPTCLQKSDIQNSTMTLCESPPQPVPVSVGPLWDLNIEAITLTGHFYSHISQIWIPPPNTHPHTHNSHTTVSSISTGGVFWLT